MLLMSLVGDHPDLAARSVVAVFDHGTGKHAIEAVHAVRVEARRHGMDTVSERSWSPAGNEAAWRAQRWSFLRRVAGDLGATIVTAHTRSDRVETVVMRILRGAGSRGLAALDAPSDVLRPLRELDRSDVARLLAGRGLSHIVDPANEDLRHLRVRVRLELLPALRTVRPTIDNDLLEIAGSASRWRAEVEQVVDRLDLRPEPGGGIRIASRELEGYDVQELEVLWPAIAARVGLVLNRRGTLRLASVTRKAKSSRIPLSGEWEAARLRDDWVLRPVVPPGPSRPRRLEHGLRHGRWHFRELPEAGLEPGWLEGFRAARLPGDVELSVRSWEPGDRIRAAGRGERGGGGSERRVKRFFSDARISAADREGWPVVLAAGEIVWVPGACRSAAATVRSGRPARIFVCERG